MCVPDIFHGDNCIREEHGIVLNVWASEVKKPCSKKECIVYMYMWEKLVEELTHRQPHRVQSQPVLMPSPSLALSSHLPPSLSRSALSGCYHNNTWNTCTSLVPRLSRLNCGGGAWRERAQYTLFAHVLIISVIPLHVTAKMSSNNNKVIIVAILRVVAHTLLIKCIHLTAISHVKSAERGVYVQVAKNFFLQRVVIIVTVCTEWGWVAL